MCSICKKSVRKDACKLGVLRIAEDRCGTADWEPVTNKLLTPLKIGGEGGVGTRGGGIICPNALDRDQSIGGHGQ